YFGVAPAQVRRTATASAAAGVARRPVLPARRPAKTAPGRPGHRRVPGRPRPPGTGPAAAPGADRRAASPGARCHRTRGPEWNAPTPAYHAAAPRARVRGQGSAARLASRGRTALGRRRYARPL